MGPSVVIVEASNHQGLRHQGLRGEGQQRFNSCLDSLWGPVKVKGKLQCDLKGLWNLFGRAVAVFSALQTLSI